MIINQKNKSMDMEARDINYILPAYVRSYLFHSKNELPEKIIFPMFESVNVVGTDRQLISIHIEWVPPLGAIATEISKDGEAIAEVTPEQEAEIDRKDDEIKRLKAEVESLTPKVSDDRCGAYAEHWKELGKPEGWTGCSLSKGHEGAHRDDVSDLHIEGLTPEEQDYEAAKADLTPAPEDILRQQEEDALADQEAAFAAEAEAEAAAKQADEYEAEHGNVPRRPDGSVSSAKAAFAESSTTETTEKPPTSERKPKQPPGGDIGPGLPLSNMQARGGKDQVQTAKDLLEEPEIDESREKEFEQTVSRDEQGRPVVGEKKEDG